MNIDQFGYESKFPSGPLREKALAQALDIRKFEIEMYWKRASYFWTLIAVCFAGYGLTFGKANIGFVPTALCCIGLVLSVGWSLVIKGSKQWQENWENHVEMLEDSTQGPLYKTVLRRPEPIGFRARSKQLLTGPASFSVSSINQLISYFISIVWLTLLITTLDFGASQISVPKIALVSLSVVTCALFFLVGRTHLESHTNDASTRAVTVRSKVRI
ncbi:hypothetical protein KWH29_12520 [Xanthomonas campestris pv. paulliniae]|uniref:RipA family octameric membrane protein n=1 Tax=Xanthomonas euvesicatoria TaxID=456327 RepID=UPI001C4794F8|nr:hypothetical protein [Xanthomonas euvesicatoria]MBV6846165.1 hypothetical protein [Xanthomonas campestris pv. paulliniae]